MINALDPERMTAEERLDEVADILAAGLFRLRRRESANNSNDGVDGPIPRHRSVPYGGRSTNTPLERSRPI